MMHPQVAVKEGGHTNQVEESGGQGRLREGPLRKLGKAELQLLEDLGLLTLSPNQIHIRLESNMAQLA